jgi:hypothetical protein
VQPARLHWALAVAEAMAGVAIFPNLSAEQRGKGFTDFKDLGIQNPEIVSRQLDEVLRKSGKNICGSAVYRADARVGQCVIAQPASSQSRFLVFSQLAA